MKTNQFYKYSAIILLLINISLVTFFVIKKKGHHNPGHLHAAKTLNLTDDQADQFKILAKEHHQALMSVKEQQLDLLNTYFQSLYNDSSTSNEEELAAISAIETKKIELTYNHFLQVKQMLTADQQKNYKEFIQETVQKVLGGKRGKQPHK